MTKKTPQMTMGQIDRSYPYSEVELTLASRMLGLVSSKHKKASCTLTGSSLTFGLESQLTWTVAWCQVFLLDKLNLDFRATNLGKVSASWWTVRHTV